MQSKFVTHVTGARPNFPKAGPVIKALRDLGIEQRLVHTGQHYDDKMSEIFFQELNLPSPDVNLGVGSGKHGEQTAKTMVLLEEDFTNHRPNLVIVYGDINSTLAASLVAAKMGIPIAHVEAGLRSFDRDMPEEINRIVTDQLADLLFATSPEAVAFLAREGVDPEKIHFVGNPMIDTLLSNIVKADVIHRSFGFQIPESFVVATLHRPSNVDNQDETKAIVKALHDVANIIPIIVPLHPRGKATLERFNFSKHANITIVEPLGYLDFISLVRESKMVITDSGGVQEETTILKVPCLTLRKNTERPITITSGSNQLVGTDNLVRIVELILDNPAAEFSVPPFWDGNAGSRIGSVIQKWLYKA